jgi:uncharacterized protein
MMKSLSTTLPYRESTLVAASEVAQATVSRLGLHALHFSSQHYTTSGMSLAGDHGPAHWERVLLNGALLHCLTEGRVDMDVIYYFAAFHDAGRINEYDDPPHGLRGARLFIRYAQQQSLSLSQHKQQLIYDACANHTHQLFSEDIDIAACFDADRLDLNRVLIYPDIHRLNLQGIITDTIIADASERARQPLTRYRCYKL